MPTALRAREEQAVDAGVGGEGLARHVPGAEHDVEHAVGHARLAEDAVEGERR